MGEHQERRIYQMSGHPERIPGIQLFVLQLYQLRRHSPVLPQWHRPCSTQRLHFPQATLFATQHHSPHDTGPGPTWCHSQDHWQNTQKFLNPNMPSAKTLSMCAPGLRTSSPALTVGTKSIWKAEKPHRIWQVLPSWVNLTMYALRLFSNLRWKHHRAAH